VGGDLRIFSFWFCLSLPSCPHTNVLSPAVHPHVYPTFRLLRSAPTSTLCVPRSLLPVHSPGPLHSLHYTRTRPLILPAPCSTPAAVATLAHTPHPVLASMCPPIPSVARMARPTRITEYHPFLCHASSFGYSLQPTLIYGHAIGLSLLHSRSLDS
jgi:hypothetical protein